MSEANRVGTLVTLSSHGFGRGDPVRFDGDDWVRATEGDLGVGVVGSVPDNNTFEFVQLGELGGLDGLTPGSVYYPDSTGVGLSTTVNGSPVAFAYTESTIFVICYSETSGSGSDTFDHSILATNTALAAVTAAVVA